MVTASLSCARLFQDWPWRRWKLVSLRVLRSGSSSEIQSSKTEFEVELEAWKGICSGSDELSWQQEGQKLHRTCQQYADCFQKPGLLYEHQDALPIFTYGPVSWEPGFNVWRAGGEITSGPERDGDLVSGTQSWWLTTVGIWREISLPLSIPGVQRNGSSRPEVWTMVKQHAIYVYLALSMPTIQFTVINVSIR